MDIEQKLHMKLGIFDNYIAVLGSSNWSYQGFEVNHECNVLIIDNKIVSELTKCMKLIGIKVLLRAPLLLMNSIFYLSAISGNNNLDSRGRVYSPNKWAGKSAFTSTSPELQLT